MFVYAYVCVCACACEKESVCVKNAGVAGMLSVYQESEGPSRLLLHFESRTHADMNVIGGN